MVQGTVCKILSWNSRSSYDMLADKLHTRLENIIFWRMLCFNTDEHSARMNAETHHVFEYLQPKSPRQHREPSPSKFCVHTTPSTQCVVFSGDNTIDSHVFDHFKSADVCTCVRSICSFMPPCVFNHLLYWPASIPCCPQLATPSATAIICSFPCVMITYASSPANPASLRTVLHMQFISSFSIRLCRNDLRVVMACYSYSDSAPQKLDFLSKNSQIKHPHVLILIGISQFWSEVKQACRGTQGKKTMSKAPCLTLDSHGESEHT